MSQLLKINSHAADAVARLISQFQSKTKMVSIINLFATRTQTIEDCLSDFYSRLNLTSSAGTQLDNFGGIVGQPRDSVSDRIYKILLRTRIGVNTSKSVPENLIDIVKELTTKPEENFSIERTRADILDSRAGLVFRHQPGAKNILIRVGTDTFLNDLVSGDTLNGFAITSNTAVTLGGFAYRNIGATDLPTIPFIGARFTFNFLKPGRTPKIRYYGLGGYESAIGTDGIALTDIDIIVEALQQIVPAGSRTNYLSVYLPEEESFAFSGSDDGGGFNEGRLATLYTIPGIFEFDAGDGFGSVRDPLVGGKFVA